MAKVFCFFFSKKKAFSSTLVPPYIPPMLRLLLALLLLPAAAQALESQPVTTTHTRAALVSEADSAAPGKPFRVGLDLRIQPGWHTYWQNPGDAGAAPTLDIDGAKAGPIAYPVPQKLQDGPFTSYAYTDHVLLPVTVTPGALPAHLTAHATWLVCASVCVPEEGSFTLDVPAGTGAPGAQAPLFAEADARSPRPSPFPALIAPDGTLTLRAPSLSPQKVLFLPDEPGVIDQGADQGFAADAGGLTVHLKPVAKLNTLGGVLLLTDQGGRTEALTIAAKPGAASAPKPRGVGLAEALALAFLGGLVLNLMPCVLPVLAMKALALARLSGAAKQHVRREAALYTAGVLAAFGTIGAVTLAVGAAGGAAGWGVQFQSVTFTAAMALLMLGVGLNFAGVFEIGAGAAGVGQSLAQRGSFFTGLLAVVVATPCTAPFMATALAAAVALPPAYGMAVFLALGLGLAFPYAILAVTPALAGLLPRPGAWMDRLKRVLALPMFATAAWMAWVVTQQAGRAGLIWVGVAAVMLTLGATFWGRTQRGEAARMPYAVAGFVFAAVALGFVALQPASSSAMSLAPGAEAFSPARLAALREKHRPVLVDMSAAWCITCLVNERVALSPPRVRDAFAKHDVAYLVGDWTRQDPAITQFLHEYGRNGVPLYVYFPAEGAPVVLPQILTEAAILDHVGA
jgi:thiol:disulfide interchange protein DsbD